MKSSTGSKLAIVDAGKLKGLLTIRCGGFVIALLIYFTMFTFIYLVLYKYSMAVGVVRAAVFCMCLKMFCCQLL